MYIDHHVKYPLMLSEFNETPVFSACFREALKYLVKIRQVWAEFHATETQTDRHDEKNRRFSRFCDLSCNSVHRGL